MFRADGDRPLFVRRHRDRPGLVALGVVRKVGGAIHVSRDCGETWKTDVAVFNSEVSDADWIDRDGSPLLLIATAEGLRQLKPFGDLSAVVLQSEPQGFRLTLPSKRPDLGPVGLSLATALRGDFEVTTTFEILKAEEPKTGHGVGVLLAITPAARIGRLVRADGRQVVLWDRWVVVGWVPWAIA